MSEELLVVLNRSENSGFGFSLLGKPGLPPIIYNILDDSPAAESGEVEVGDVILKVNETDVNRFSTKEVLKCLRLSSDPVTLKIKRDPKIKATVRKHLLSVGGDSAAPRPRPRPGPLVHQSHVRNGSCPPEQQSLLSDPDDNDRLQWEPLAASDKKPSNKPKFEAYMMTGEHILNISRMPKQQKKIESLRYHNSHTHHLRHQQQHNSVPNSPNEMDMGSKGNHCKSGSNSANTSPVSANKWDTHPSPGSGDGSKYNSNFVRTSRSEDQLQASQNDNCGMSAVNIDVDDDITSSLNTLLDTRPESVSASGDSDRIVWTYNAPPTGDHHAKFCHTLSNGSSSSHSNTSPSSSPLHSGSPASPTSVSSSVMSSQSGSRRLPYTPTGGVAPPPPTNGDFSVSEAISNISSPDYHDDDSMGIRDCVMEISDHSDSDSTLLVSEPRQRQNSDHRIVIQVKGPDNRGKTCDSQNEMVELADLDDDGARNPSPQSSEDESDVESLHSFHYSPKAVDLPSAIRLAKRLYSLDGFKKSDVSRHLSKNNDFSRAVAEEYLKYFNFENDTLDIALRKFLKQFSLTGETQERERVLVHFSKRYLDCNPGSFNSQDAVHTLTCAIMLLNTDLHGQNISRKMTCNEFIENLAGLNEQENFPRDVLKALYHAIKNYPLEWALDEDTEDGAAQMPKPGEQIGANPFLDVPMSSNAVEYKKGYVMRKCCYEANAKRSLCCIFLAPFHKRSWKMFYCTLRDLVLYLHKDENGFRKNQMGDNFHNAIRIHHALATKATDYTKKMFVFRLQTADQAEYLFQTGDSKELQSWIDTINFVAASFSAAPLEAAVGSQKKFQRPLLPCSHTKLNMREQLRDHEERVLRLESELEDHRKSPPDKGSKSLIVQNYKEKESYLTFEVKRYRTYSYILRSRIGQYVEPHPVSLVENSIGEVDEAAAAGGPMDVTGGVVVPPPIPDRPAPSTNRCSFSVHITYFPRIFDARRGPE
ncbi:PH and SEC7 domain-containing protein isoform X1 [Tribolium castaneum]|uniref:PH and SEC7 domain-containing protein isoform X1 n=1 Tax=Tribolium castaneum TaxID=7070 RepID=UPI00046BEEE3|nr:PREDICTED: PH and SEC7 domain-containing protein 1 isoform X4 [Tribolium castaneum]|eukprot:XP_008198766.1 PREDICTED: PH and SEC7 domain-containing protein 1 isoform X4 [Tribolium castaneum]